MTLAASYAVSGFMLHQLLSALQSLALVLLCGIFIAATLGAMTRRLQRRNESWQTMMPNWAVTIVKSATRGPQWVSAGLRSIWDRFHTQNNPGSGLARYAPVWMAAALAVGGALAITNLKPRYETEEYFNVAILAKLSVNEWLLERQDGSFRYRACPGEESLSDAVIGVGWVAKRVKFLQKDGCESIRPMTYGFFYDHPPREVYPGSGERRKVWGGTADIPSPMQAQTQVRGD